MTDKEFDVTKGYGFITGEDNEDYFVHVSGLCEYLKSKGLLAGQRVSFDVNFGMRSDKVINVRID
tara:strand:+ start:604 stop:798 length:195 start_codon:yes stop_codon:yes gene_type:complete